MTEAVSSRAVRSVHRRREAAVKIADDRDLRQQLVAHHVNIVARRRLGEIGRNDIRIVGRRQSQRFVARHRQRRPLGRQHQPARRMTDRADKIGAAGLELALGGDAVGGCLRQRQFGLGHVGAGHLADAKAFARRIELLFQHRLVVAVDLDQSLVAVGIEKRLNDRLEDRGLDGEGLGTRRTRRC